MDILDHVMRLLAPTSYRKKVDAKGMHGAKARMYPGDSGFHDRQAARNWAAHLARMPQMRRETANRKAVAEHLGETTTYRERKGIARFGRRYAEGSSRRAAYERRHGR